MNTTLKAFGFLIVLYIRRSKALFFSSENTPNQTYLCASYTRLSQDDGDKEESNSIVNQKALIATSSLSRIVFKTVTSSSFVFP